MLPDYFEIKKEVSRALADFVQRRVRYHRGFGDLKEHTLFEGRRGTRLVRSDGSVDDTQLHRRSVEIEMNRNEQGIVPLATVVQRMDDAAAKMAGHIATDLYDAVGKAADDVGNSVHANGKKVSAELILEAFEKVQIDFDAKLQPLLPTLHMHPSLREAADAAFRALQTDADLRRQFETLMMKKREEWREREASRALVG